MAAREKAGVFSRGGEMLRPLHGLECANLRRLSQTEHFKRSIIGRRVDGVTTLVACFSTCDQSFPPFG